MGERTNTDIEDIEELKQEAEEFLSSRYFYAASDIFEKILKNNPNDKDGHIGLLLTSNKIGNEEALIRYYQNLYSEEDYEIKLAADREEKHIEEMCERFCIPDYLEKEDIRRAYEFDLSYKSDVFSRRKQKEEILKTIEGNEHLSWLKEKGFREIADILKAYDRRIDEAKENDRENVQRIKSEYQRFLYVAYSEVKKLNEEAREKKEKDYQGLVREYDALQDIDKLRELSLQFERFKDYKDGKNYIGFCNEKIEKISESKKDDEFKKTILNSLDEAKADLVTGKFSKAYDGFMNVVSMDPGNEEGHLGILMAGTKTTDTDELFDYYKSLYAEDAFEILEACEEDSKHIEDMAEKYYLPEFLEKETIYEKYLYDRTYRSCLNSRIKEEERFKEEMESDPVFEWLRENGSSKIRNQIQELYDTYALRVKEAREEDRKKAEQIRNDYQRFLFKVYSSIKDLHKKATDRKEESYRQLIHSFDLADSESELKDLIRKLEDLGEYKESSRYISLCRKKIEELQEKKKADFIDQDIETALIAGRTYLSSGNEELADESFAKVLSLDPGNPRAYLGILMLETGSRNIDELVDHYKNLYNEDETKILEACEPETDHIRAMAEKYAIKGYLDEETIEKYYSFDRSFESVTASRIEQRDQFNEEVRMNPLLAKVALGTDEEIKSFLQRVRDGYEARIDESKNADEKQIASIRHIYEVYLNESDKTVLRIHEEKLKEKNEDDEARYLRNIERFNKDLSTEELEELSKSFDLDYKDGPVYVKKCKDRIRDIRIEQEKDKLASLLENGTALLQSDLYNEAKERFESYLEIDPKNEEAHLKLLMAEKKVSDIDALFDYYKGLYSDEILETKNAIEENKDHIEDIVNRCYIPELLEKEDIRKRYVFDRSYGSLLQARIVQKQQIEDEIDLDPTLSWLYENGSDEVQDHIEDFLETYDQRIEEAKEEDKYLSDTIKKEYRVFIRNTDREVRSLYNELNKERNRKLKDLEKERRESELKAKEEEERLRRLKEEERKEKLRIEEERRILEENARREALIKEESERQKKTAEKEALENEEQIKQKQLQDRRAEEEKQRLEKEASLKLAKEKEKQEKKQKALEDKLLRQEQRKQKAEEKAALKAARQAEKKEEPVKTFKPNFALIAAGLSLALLAFVVYTYVIAPSRKYNNALSLVEQGQYDEAIDLFEQLNTYRDSDYQVKSVTYLKADDLYQKGDLRQAVMIFNDLRFDDSEDRARMIKKEMISSAAVGDMVLFGEYEQDGNTDNGKEMVEWIVLERQEGRVLVLSKDAIEAQKFNASSEETYWENCSLRSWLNGRFPDNAFAKEDPSYVLSTTISNERYPISEEGEERQIDELILETYETRDRLFLLSMEEVERYFPNEEERIALASDSAIENGVAAGADNSCSWWLRTPDPDTLGTVLTVKGSDGTISRSMYEITNGVRPAMWIRTD